MPLVDKITSMPRQSPKVPVWAGPEEDGITTSLLNRYLSDKERFRLLVVEGLKPVERFNKYLEFGNMWHECEELLAGWPCAPILNGAVSPAFEKALRERLAKYGQVCCKKYPFDREDVDKWLSVVSITFPVYVRYWSQHPDVIARKPLMQERVFTVPIVLPNGRVVNLKGKYDSVDAVEKGIPANLGIWLMENKSKSEVDEAALRRQLKLDLQTMLYVTSIDAAMGAGACDHPPSSDFHELHEWMGTAQAEIVRLVGVRYNVIRRPLSGGKGMIRPHKEKLNKKTGVVTEPAETMEHYYNRLRVDYLEAEPETYFYRWNVEVTPADIQRFKDKVLFPLLMELCEWYDWVRDCKIKGKDPFKSKNGIHSLHPYGVRNIIDEGGATDLDSYIETGSEAGLTRVTELFPELTQAAD